MTDYLNLQLKSFGSHEVPFEDLTVPSAAVAAYVNSLIHRMKNLEEPCYIVISNPDLDYQLNQYLQL